MVCVLCVVVLPVGRSVVLVSRRVCLLRKRSVLESEEGIIVYSIYLRLRRPTGHWALLRADPLDRAPRWIETSCIDLLGV